MDLEFADATAASAGALRAAPELAGRALLAAAGLAEKEAAGRRDAGLIGLPSRSPAIASPALPRLNLNSGANRLNNKSDSRTTPTINAQSLLRNHPPHRHSGVAT